MIFLYALVNNCILPLWHQIQIWGPSLRPRVDPEEVSPHHPAPHPAVHPVAVSICLPEVSSGAMDGEGWGPPRDPLTPGHQDTLLERRAALGLGTCTNNHDLVKKICSSSQLAVLPLKLSVALWSRGCFIICIEKKRRKKEIVNIS